MKPSFTRLFQTAEFDVPHAHDTANIPEGKIGLGGVRQNIDEKLDLLVYGKVITGDVDPIEKKPVVH